MLILNSEKEFEDYYKSFPTRFVKWIFHQVISNIQTFRVGDISQYLIREGITLIFNTATTQGSSVGYFFPLD